MKARFTGKKGSLRKASNVRFWNPEMGKREAQKKVKLVGLHEKDMGGKPDSKS